MMLRPTNGHAAWSCQKAEKHVLTPASTDAAAARAVKVATLLATSASSTSQRAPGIEGRHWRITMPVTSTSSATPKSYYNLEHVHKANSAVSHSFDGCGPPGLQRSASSPVRMTVIEIGSAPMARHCMRSCTRTCGSTGRATISAHCSARSVLTAAHSQRQISVISL